ncbi:hypothetical protein QFC22_002896 [Naganishia vaughanmartiniae]|uniref:Uncharacterized protein n=1 Tax=Naganishia vaughanmartiniae TaxID=1424756 RepID=A0ACC2XC66_9TREE|nr:hypothetical protein QFC22_002896 [Naganishia vaughanmartiniae]
MVSTITEFLANEDDTVSVGQDLLKIEPGTEGASGSAPAAKEEKPAASKEDPPAKDDTKPDASVADKSEAKSPAQEQPKKQEAPKPAPAKSEKPAPKDTSKQAVEQKVAGSRNETRVKMSRMRTTIAKRLKQSQEVAASLTTFNEIDMSALMKFRTKYKDLILKEQGVKLGFMSAFAKASCLALKEIPAGNASLDGDSIIYRDYVDLSVAVATEKGLVTPIVRNAESMGLIEIEQAIAGLGKKVSWSDSCGLNGVTLADRHTGIDRHEITNWLWKTCPVVPLPSPTVGSLAPSSVHRCTYLSLCKLEHTANLLVIQLEHAASRHFGYSRHQGEACRCQR